MADNTAVTNGAGDVYRSKDRAGVKTDIVGIDVGIGGTEALMSAANPMPTAEQTSGTAAITSAALAVTSFTILAANTARRGATFFNDSVNVVYLAPAATATTTAYMVQIPAGGYFELPRPVYTGLIVGIALVATGSVRVAELT